MQPSILGIILPDFTTRLLIPLALTRVCAGFPSPADDYIEGRIDLNRDLIRNEFSTFYFRMSGDSMYPDIKPGTLLIVDRKVDTVSGDVIVARLDGDLCVRTIHIDENGFISLFSANPIYSPIKIREGSDFEVFGGVIHAIQSFNNIKITPSETY